MTLVVTPTGGDPMIAIPRQAYVDGKIDVDQFEELVWSALTDQKLVSSWIQGVRPPMGGASMHDADQILASLLGIPIRPQSDCMAPVSR